MKKLVLSLLLLGGTTVVFAQSANLQTAGRASQIPTTKGISSEPRVACANDELDYCIAKNIGDNVRLIGLQANQTTAIAAGAQYFPAGQPVTVSGLWVLGRKPTAGTITLKASIYSATADSLPNTELGSGTLTITTTSANIGYVQINFASPVTTSQPYIVAVENQTASPAFQICTNYFTASGDTASGRGEGLAKAKYGGNWLKPASLFTGFNADFIISPKVSYSNTADFTLSANSACVNNAVTLTNTSSPLYSSRFYNINAFLNHFAAIPDSTFRWTLPSGQQYSTNATVNSATAGAVNAKLKATLIPWQNVPDCVDSITKTITYNALDNATFAYATNTLCSGAPNPTPTTSVAGTFSSTGGLVFVSTTTGEIDMANSPDGTYTITYNTSGACPNSSSQNFTITSAPDASFSYAASSYCRTASNPSPIFGVGAGAGTFSSTTGLSITAGTGEINLAASTPGTYTVTNTIAASGSCPASSETFDVTVIPAPTATVSGGGALCAGSANTVPVTVTLTGTGPWSITISDGVNSQTLPVLSSPATVQAGTAQAGTYTVTNVTDQLCSNVGTGSATVSVNPLPTITFADATACTGAPYTLVAAPAGGNFSGTGVTGNQFDPAAGTQTVTYTYTNGNGCTNSANAVITVNTTPTVSWTAPSSACIYNPTFTLQGGTPAGGTYSGTGVSGQSFNPATAGLGTHAVTYSVTVGGCTGTTSSNIVVSECAGIEDIVANSGLAIYPNPSQGNVTFTFSNTDVKNVNLTIVSTEGKVVYQNNFQSKQATVDLSTLAHGTYFVRVIADGKSNTAKLVLNK